MDDSLGTHTRDAAAIPRRTLIRAGIWSVPVIAAATAAPLAAASTVGSLEIFATRSSTAMLPLQTLDGTSVQPEATTTLPIGVTIWNRAGSTLADSGATLTLACDLPDYTLASGIARGVAVYSFAGVVIPSSARSIVYAEDGAGTPAGFPRTSFTTALPLNISAGTFSYDFELECRLTNETDSPTIDSGLSFPFRMTLRLSDGTVAAENSQPLYFGPGANVL